MSKPFTEADFSAQITEDRNWRMREISDLKTAAERADENLRKALLRSLVAICYAHWEGYVAFAAHKYLEYIALRKYQYRELNRQFLRNYFLPRLAALSATRKGLAERCSLIDEILDSSQRRYTRVNESLINTKANLNFEVFTDICLVCNLSPKAFDGKAIFIDVFLLKRRNQIAHGEETFIEVSDLEELAETTISLMRTFGDELENHIYLKGYKSPQKTAHSGLTKTLSQSQT